MTRVNFALFLLWTIVSFGFCQADDEIADKDVVRAVVEVCVGHVIIQHAL